MSQFTFPNVEFSARRTQMQHHKFLTAMDNVPLVGLSTLIEPVYSRSKRGRFPQAPETMLRICFMQLWFALSDPATQEANHDMKWMRQFADMSVTRGCIPDKTTILSFRRLPKEHELASQLLEEINTMLAEHRLLSNQSTITDATSIRAPASI